MGESRVSEVRPTELGETPSVEVRVYRHGELVHREFCESDDMAALVVGEWAEQEGVECEVGDLSAGGAPDDVVDVDLGYDRTEEEYPSGAWLDDRGGRRS